MFPTGIDSVKSSGHLWRRTLPPYNHSTFKPQFKTWTTSFTHKGKERFCFVKKKCLRALPLRFYRICQNGWKSVQCLYKNNCEERVRVLYACHRALVCAVRDLCLCVRERLSNPVNSAASNSSKACWEQEWGLPLPPQPPVLDSAFWLAALSPSWLLSVRQRKREREREGGRWRRQQWGELPFSLSFPTFLHYLPFHLFLCVSLANVG